MTKLLIVDDDLSLCNSLVELLSSVSHKVETAHNGRDALEFLLAFEYDAIVLDWEMPEISPGFYYRSYHSSLLGFRRGHFL